MPGAYDVRHFDLDYCQADVAKIVAAIRSKASLLAIGMPGCGKSRLIDFLLNRPGVIENHGLTANLKFIRVDSDVITSVSQGIYFEFLRALGNQVSTFNPGNPDILKNRLVVEIEKLEADTGLIVIFDNFTGKLQQELGENFFNFLFGLRNARVNLNLSYIFIGNLNLELNGFYKVNRFFDQGAVCWLSLFNRKDTIFSIERQLQRVGCSPDSLTGTQKENIYITGGGHALLTRHLTHLMLNGEISPETEPKQVLKQGAIWAACEAVWADLKQEHKNFLIDLATTGPNPARSAQLLQNYGVLKEPGQFFSPLFEHFVKEQRRTKTVIDAQCDRRQTSLVIETIDQRRLSFNLYELPQRKRRLLCYLLEHRDEICTKDQLITVGWSSESEEGVSDQALRRQIEDIKDWLKKQVRLNECLVIETIWGEGYRLIFKE